MMTEKYDIIFQGYCRDYGNRHPNLGAECAGPKTGCGGGSICSANAVCEEVPPGGVSRLPGEKYNCKCKPGFKGDGTKCEYSKYISQG